ncbi:MAG: hypothetical protein KDA69_11745, partial [Planctomycetaceae bacterium]|nr:hypothetical protein [Planctomycetaceae bacterium]
MNQSKTYINLAIVAALVALAAFFLIPRNAPGPNPPDGPDVPPLANANELISEFQLSLAELENSDYEAAAPRLEALAKQLPHETAVHRNLALTYLVGIDALTGYHEPQKVARREELLSLLDSALDRLKEFPDEQIPWALFSSRRAQALKQDAQAIEFLKTAIELAPEDPAFPYEMSRVAYSSPDNTLQAAGLEGLEKAYAANPENLWVLQEVLVRQAEAKSTGLSDTLEKATTALGVVQSEILRKHRIDVVELITAAKESLTSDNSSVLMRNIRIVANVLRPEDAAQSDKIQLEKHPLEFVALSLSSDVLSQAVSEQTNAEQTSGELDFEQVALPDELAKDAIDVAVGDFDLNEIDDLCVLRTNEVALWGRQEQDGEWSLICSAALDADYTNVIAVDLDADEREAPRAVKADLPGNPDCRRADMD